jgi:hypothetical protein
MFVIDCRFCPDWTIRSYTDIPFKALVLKLSSSGSAGCFNMLMVYNFKESAPTESGAGQVLFPVAEAIQYRSLDHKALCSTLMDAHGEEHCAYPATLSPTFKPRQQLSAEPLPGGSHEAVIPRC